MKLKASKKRTKLKLKLNRQENGNKFVLVVSKERTGRVDQMTHDDWVIMVIMVMVMMILVMVILVMAMMVTV